MTAGYVLRVRRRSFFNYYSNRENFTKGNKSFAVVKYFRDVAMLIVYQGKGEGGFPGGLSSGKLRHLFLGGVFGRDCAGGEGTL